MTYLYQSGVLDDSVFTHFYYVPVILAAIWWRKKGFIVPLFIVIMLVASRLYFSNLYLLPHDLIRIISLIVVFIIIVVLRDYIVRVQGQLISLNEQLEQKVLERTNALEIAHKQLVKQERLVALGRLAGSVSHELRNPLGVIKNTSYFLNMAIKDKRPEIEEALTLLDAEVSTSENIIRSLLDFARPGPLVKQEVDLHSIMKRALLHSEKPANVEIIAKICQTGYKMLADPEQLDQIFNNILRNAFQAMPDGGHIIIADQKSDHGTLILSFTDTGIGISAENLDNIFEPLFTTKAKGIGLGLAHVKSLVEKHGGTTTVKSVPGQGTTVYVELPVENTE